MLVQYTISGALGWPIVLLEFSGLLGWIIFMISTVQEMWGM